ncbi:hypothetical protein [Chitinimonas lacunae]|uniref:DUF1573 domain-containing protein n=1 Tax=Chitinimonas lacunae TaxID=1963018 RepID=A0ABV8MV18_9NEIS
MKLRPYAGLAGTALLLAALSAPAIAADPPPIMRDEIRLDSPEGFNFGRVGVGQESRRSVLVTYDPFDKSAAKVTLNTPEISDDVVVCTALNCPQPNSKSFKVVEDGCTGKQLGTGESCKLTLAFAPVAPTTATGNDVTYTARLRVSGSRPYLNDVSHVEARAVLTGTVAGSTNPGHDHTNTDKAYDYIEKLMPGMFKPIATGSFYSRCYARSLCLAEQNGMIYLYQGESMTPVIKVEDVLKLIGSQP